MASILHRFRRPRPRRPESGADGTGTEDPGAAPDEPTPDPSSEELDRTPSEAPSSEELGDAWGPEPAPAPATEAVIAPGGAPPLPQAKEARSVHHRAGTRPTRCFVCDTELAGAFCPTCRMTWVE